jgi:hypothetical protein
MALFKPDTNSASVKAFQRAGLPFISGISGSIEHLVLCMEEVTPEAPYGRVPDVAMRDKLLVAYAAILVATGMHSLGECAAAAINLGYWGGDSAELMRTGYTYIGSALRRMDPCYSAPQYRPPGQARPRLHELRGVGRCAVSARLRVRRRPQLLLPRIEPIDQRTGPLATNAAFFSHIR